MMSQLLSGYPDRFMLEMKRCKALQTLVEVRGFEPPASSSRTKRATKLRYTPWCFLVNGRDRIRTCEGVRQQIYSLPPLSTWVLALETVKSNGPGRGGQDMP